MIDSYIRRTRWEAQEQAVAALTLQAQAMGGGKKSATPEQAAPKRKPPIMGMEQFIKSQGLG